MPELKILLPLAFSATTAVLAMAASSAMAEAPSGAAQIEPLTQATVAKTIGGVVVQLRDGYVFADKGAHAADALEKSPKGNAYMGVTHPVQFAQQVTDQVRAITKDSHMRVIFGSPFAHQPARSAPKDAGFEVRRLDGKIGYLHLARCCA